MGRWHSWRLCRHARFRLYRRLGSAITLANQRESHLVSDRIFKDPIAVQSRFSGGGLFPLRTASRFGVSSVGIHPRRTWRSQILNYETNPLNSFYNPCLRFLGGG